MRIETVAKLSDTLDICVGSKSIRNTFQQFNRKFKGKYGKSVQNDPVIDLPSVSL